MKHIIMLFTFVLCSFVLATETVIQLSEKIGDEIDQLEKVKYHLFQDVEGFQKARVLLVNKNFYVQYTIENDFGIFVKRQSIKEQAIKATQMHIKFVEEFETIDAEKNVNDAETLYRLGLKYSAQAQYNLSPLFFNELVTNYPTSPFAQKALLLKNEIGTLSSTKKALYLPGSLADKSGRTEFLIFSGYYGVWLGMATPIFFEADSPQVYALGLLLGGPASFLLAYNITKETNMSDGRAIMISLGGHLGTWQGIGWGIVADADGNNTIGLGELAGLTGIGIATAITANDNFSTTHAGLTNYSMYWGAWFGLVLGNITKSDDVLRDMLITTDIAVLSTALLAKNVEMSKMRYRLINLAGVLGTVVGFGFDLLFEVNSEQTAFALAGIGSITGLMVGRGLTKSMDANKFSFLGNTDIRSGLAFKRHPIMPHKLIPTASLTVRF